MPFENILYYSPKISLFITDKALCDTCGLDINKSGVAVTIWGKINQNLFICLDCLRQAKHKHLLINFVVSEFKDFSIVQKIPKDAYMVQSIPASLNLQNSSLSVFDNENIKSEFTEDKTKYANKTGFYGLSLDDNSPVVKGLPLTYEDKAINNADTYKDILQIENNINQNFNFDNFINEIKNASLQIENKLNLISFDVDTIRELAIKQADLIRNTINLLDGENEKLSAIMSLNVLGG